MEQQEEWSKIQTEKPEKEKVEFEVEKDEPKQEVKKEEPEVKKDEPKEEELSVMAINKDNYEEFLPPSRLNFKGTKDPNPELLTWASENMGAWESFVNSLPNEKPKQSDYTEDQQGLDQQYGEDLRFYNLVVKNLKRQLPKIQKLVKDRE